MHNAELYKETDSMQRHDAKETIDQFSHLFRWRRDGSDSILDIGVGSGDVTMDFILPVLPPNFERLVGTDLCDEMLQYVRSHYTHPKVSWIKMDISEDIKTQPCSDLEPVDHIVSWVKEQECSARNMHYLLKPGGDLLVAFLIHNPIFDIYKKMSRNVRWAKYMDDVDDYIGPYHYSKDPAGEYEEVLASSGFTGIKIAIREKSFTFVGVDTLKNAVKAVNPFIDRIPWQAQNEFLDEYIDHVVALQLALDDPHSNKDTCRFIAPYTFLIAYAKRK